MPIRADLRSKLRMRMAAVAAVSALIAPAFPAAGGAANLKVLHSFCVEQFCPDGLDPINGLLRDGQGNLYGETVEGGTHGHGTVFQLYRPPGKNKYKIRVLRDFCFKSGEDGCTGPEVAGLGGHLIIDTEGGIYGTGGLGGVNGNGLVFKLTPHNGGRRWTYRVLYDFCSVADCADGFSPASLTYAGAATGAPYDGVSWLYGVSQYGGKNGKGVAFALEPKARGQWTEQVLYDFCAEVGCADGQNPAFDLLLDANGNLFGVTSDLAIHNPGVVFKLSPGPGSVWNETVLHAFCSAQDCTDGQLPSGGVVMDASENLFGVTTFGGDNLSCRAGLGCGVAYKITPDGAYSVVHSFGSQNPDGAEPSGRLATDAGGNLYGTASSGGARGGGTLFRLGSDGYETIFDFCSGACGDAPVGPNDGVVLDPDGNFLGTAGGGKVGVGAAYQLTP